MSKSELETTILNNIPQTGVSLIFGYGSRVVKQSGQQKPSELIDIIIATDSPFQWHQENYHRNRQHYSFIKYLPNAIEKITKIQECYGAQVYFNPFVKVDNLLVKYGVIKTDHLINDLKHWDKLYIAGRLHKPVEFIVNTCDRNEPLRTAIRFNKESAIRVATLHLPEVFDSTQLYKTITNLSYNGDLRMMFGEDKNKIENIVSSQKDRFDQLYLPIIKSSFSETVQWNEGKQIFTQDLSSGALLKNIKLLPLKVRRTLCKIHAKEARTLESDAALASVARSINCDKIIALALATIVRQSSTSQSIKGLLTAGVLKSLKYSQRKLAKSLMSRINWN